MVALGRLLRRVHGLVGSMRMFTILLGDMEEEVRMRAIYEMSDDIVEYESVRSIHSLIYALWLDSYRVRGWSAILVYTYCTRANRETTTHLTS